MISPPVVPEGVATFADVGTPRKDLAPLGVAGGSLFVLEGTYRAVLINNYPPDKVGAALVAADAGHG